MNCLKCNLETTNPKFCSKSCSASYHNAIKPKRKRLRTCEFSGCSEGVLSGRKYCGEHKSSSLNRRVDRGKGKWNQYTKEELFSDLSYTHAQSVIRKDARDVFLKSGRDQSCEVCGYSTFFDVAHIKPVKDFDPHVVITDINTIENLAALCPNHHRELDAGLISIR